MKQGSSDNDNSSIVAIDPRVASRKLFGAGGPFGEWASWTMPRPSLKIDDFVIKVLEGIPSQSGALSQKRKDFQARGVACPFYSARFFALRAIEWADVASSHVVSARNEAAELTRRAAEAERLVASLDKWSKGAAAAFSAHGGGFGLGGHLRGPVPPEVLSIADRNAMLSEYGRAAELHDGAAGLASEIGSTAERFRADALELVAFLRKEAARVKDFPRSSKNVWAQAFCEVMADAWWGLTGDAPNALAPRLMEFASEAYVSAGGADGLDWRQPVLNALAAVSRREKDGRRWNAGRGRHARGEYDPDLKILSPSQLSDWRIQQRRNHEAHLDRLIGTVRAEPGSGGDDDRVAAARELWGEWIGGGWPRDYLSARGVEFGTDAITPPAGV